jgi:hypothetical protein
LIYFLKLISFLFSSSFFPSNPLPSVPLPSVPLSSVPLPSVPLPSVPLPSVPFPAVPLPAVPFPFVLTFFFLLFLFLPLLPIFLTFFLAHHHNLIFLFILSIYFLNLDCPFLEYLFYIKTCKTSQPSYYNYILINANLLIEV